MNILITGGAGFIGSHVVRAFLHSFPDYKISNLDKLTYAGNLENLKDVEENPNYEFIKGDIVDRDFIQQLFENKKFDAVIHLAAESHVDRSISSPMDFIQTNIVGTVNLLQSSRSIWESSSESKLFYHVSTDEVYGSLGAKGFFKETTPYDPRSPYSASKASSDHLVRAYFHTYGVPIVISNCSNNYGSHQFPEKLIPLFINNIQTNKELPVYGKGENVRDWLWVEDHALAISALFHACIGVDCSKHLGETYNIGGNNEWKNLDLIKLLCKIMDTKLGREPGSSDQLIRFVKDRPGHDLRYAIDPAKLMDALAWKPSVDFEEGLTNTVDWYISNKEWLDRVTSGAYQQYYEEQYS